MIWVAPPHTHKVRYRLWKVTHWRRVRRFNAYLRLRIEEDFARRMDELKSLGVDEIYRMSWNAEQDHQPPSVS